MIGNAKSSERVGLSKLETRKKLARNCGRGVEEKEYNSARLLELTDELLDSLSRDFD